MSLHNVTYPCADDVCRGYLTCGIAEAGKTRPGVLVLHEGAGLAAETIRRADMLASAGYLALAPDLFGKTFGSRQEGIAYIGDLVQHPTKLVDRLNAALTFLSNQSDVDSSNLFAVGFCFGGYAALELARAGASLRAIAAVHGSLDTRRQAAPGSIRASVLACVGAEDPFITQKHRAAFEREMKAAKADWQINVYSGAMHAFSNPHADPRAMPGCAYHPCADRRSWANVEAFFEGALAT